MATPTEPTVTLWHGLYKASWKGDIVDAAFQHPAKFSKSLIFKIIDHAIAEGWIGKGDTVIDPFGGVGLGGLPCALRGLHHLAVELEPRFVTLANGGECGGDLAKHTACGEVAEHGPHHILGNLELWQRKYGVLPQWRQPILLQGDSRELGKIISQHLAGSADLSITSSPFQDSDGRKGGSDLYVHNQLRRGRSPASASMRAFETATPYGTHPDNLGNMKTGSIDTAISSPPYADGCTHTGGADPQPQHVQGGPLRWVAYGADQAIGSPPHCHGLSNEHTYADDAKRHKDSQRGIFTEKGIADPYYGKDKAQLGNMPLGDVAAVVQDGADCTIASPPYAQSLSDVTSRIDWSKKKGAPSGPHTPGKDGMPANYSASVSNLGNMPPGDVAAVGQGDLCAASPPWQGGTDTEGRGEKLLVDASLKSRHVTRGRNGSAKEYGSSNGQLSNTSPDTFWSAAKTIIEQTWAVLRPGAHAIWVCKNYVRNGEIVPFSMDWAKLCMAVGFEWIHWHKAMLVETHSTGRNFLGEETTQIVRRESFFRRLSREKTGVSIDHEDVLCMRKPGGREICP